MAPTISKRAELARLCITEDWDKAIEILNSLISESGESQDFYDRALCYSRLEQHNHVIEDCDSALQLDPALIQAHILKGRALEALERKEDALSQWEKGFEHASKRSVDIKQLLELEQLMKSAKQDKNIIDGDHGSTMPQRVLNSHHQRNLSETLANEDKLSAQTELCGNASDATESCDKTSINGNDSIDIAEILTKSTQKFEFPLERRNEPMKNEKFCVSRVSETESMSIDCRLKSGIAKIDEGEYGHAICIFDQMLKEEHPNPDEVLIGRGTAYALRRELDAAIADFTKAIQYNPSAWEAWKRRAQARAYMGKSVEAIGELTKALEFNPCSEHILMERGYVNLKFKEFDAAIEDFSACVKLDKNNKSAYTCLGLALSSIGQYEKAEEAHLKSLQLDRNFLEARVNLTQLNLDLAKPAKAQESLNQALKIDRRFLPAYCLRGQLFHDMGEHRKAIQVLTTGLNIDRANLACLYLRASCYHAVGKYKEAFKDYDAALDLKLGTMYELQIRAFYQKKIALYTASKLEHGFCYFDIDGDIPLLFKEYWCKTWCPAQIMRAELVWWQPSLRRVKRMRKLSEEDSSIKKKKNELIQAADSIGKKIQYDCPGFLPNRREHRMAGFAAIAIAQKVSEVWRSMKPECSKGVNIPSQNRGGAGCSTSATLKTSSWQDIYSVAVKWKQISEPCDPVVWVNNKLSKDFNSGLRTYTAMIFEQVQVVRYFPNYERTLNVAKTVMKERPFVYRKNNDLIDLSKEGKLEDIMHANSCSDLYRIVGEDFWLPTWCYSTASEGKKLEGTRICLAKMGELGFDFAIRTQCTPDRLRDFDTEMARAWEAICDAYCGENHGSSDFDVRDAILRMTYYWFNFKPLSRGSDVVGLVVMLGLLLAANMKFIGNIPQGLQVDWEAILNFDSNSFVDSIKSWLYPSLIVTTSWKRYAEVASIFSTVGSVVDALSS